MPVRVGEVEIGELCVANVALAAALAVRVGAVEAKALKERASAARDGDGEHARLLGARGVHHRAEQQQCARPGLVRGHHVHQHPVGIEARQGVLAAVALREARRAQRVFELLLVRLAALLQLFLQLLQSLLLLALQHQVGGVPQVEKETTFQP